jgi:phosphoribosylamine---glycine ligase
MKVLIIGSGGREHALAWKAAQSPLVDEVLVAPGNAGTAREPRVRNVAIAATDGDALIALARRSQVGLTIVGPEQPLVAGLVDRFEAEGLVCFGPIAAAAALEGSKAFTKAFLERHGIASASYATFTATAPALAYLQRQSLPIVIKADGLAAGKGVVIAATLAEAEDTIRQMLDQSSFGTAGARIVIEEFLTGEEASFIALVDGTDILPLASSQDHKARDDGDRGPNTGGMGAYSPAPVVTGELHARIMQDVMLPTVRGLAADGIRFRGFLYAGLMIDTAGRPKVLEFNCRFGDPETQPILMRLKSDIVALCLAACSGRLAQQPIDWDARTAVGVVMASKGYPGDYEKGLAITGLDGQDAADLKVFHAGTRLDGGQVLTDGGRVLCVTALGSDVRAARDRAYGTVDRIRWPGAFCRRDIAYRALNRER